jgi:hypothetical protein
MQQAGWCGRIASAICAETARRAAKTLARVGHSLADAIRSKRERVAERDGGSAAKKRERSANRRIPVVRRASGGLIDGRAVDSRFLVIKTI